MEGNQRLTFRPAFLEVQESRTDDFWRTWIPESWVAMEPSQFVDYSATKNVILTL
jgi:hypothetical protein